MFIPFFYVLLQLKLFCMKRFYSIVLILYLLSGFGFLAHAQETQNGFVMEQPEKQEVKIVYSGEKVTIENLPKDDVLEVFNIMGVKIHSRRVSAGTNEYELNLPKGYYILKVGKTTKKIAVK